MLALLVILSYFALSVAQQPSTACINAYNATFNTVTTCSLAIASVVFQGGGDENDRMMVCDEDQSCNQMIRNVIDVCGDTIDDVNSFVLESACTFRPDGTSCLSAFVSDGNVFDNLNFDSCGTSYLIGQCDSGCMQTVQSITDSYGCCFVLAFQLAMESGEISYDQFVFLTRSVPNLCEVVSAFCNGTIVPLSSCDTTSTALYGPNDDCSNIVRGILTQSINDISGLYEGNCFSRFQMFATECSRALDNNLLVSLATGLMSFGQAQDSNGRSCAEIVGELAGFFANDDDEFVCITDYFFKRCSDECRIALMNVTEDAGCCFNAFSAATLGYSEEVREQIEYGILTREIYSLCNVESAGFCEGVPGPQVTSDAQRCFTTSNNFFANNDTCLSNFIMLTQPSSITELSDTAFDICTNCRSRMSGYVDYLLQCRVYGDDDDDDDDDDYMDIPNLISGTLCRVDTTNRSCYSRIQADPRYLTVSAAFDDNGACESIEDDNECSTECQQLLQNNLNTLGCCLVEFGRALLGTQELSKVLSLCNIPLSTTQCEQIGGDGGAGMVKGLGLLSLLLFTVMAMFI